MTETGTVQIKSFWLTLMISILVVSVPLAGSSLILWGNDRGRLYDHDRRIVELEGIARRTEQSQAVTANDVQWIRKALESAGIQPSNH